jgi:hypothetical protein
VVASGDEGEGTGCILLGGVDDTAWIGVVALLPAGAADGCSSRGGRAGRTCVSCGGGSTTPSMATTTAVALLSGSGDRGCCRQAARDGGDLETSGVAKHHACL